MRRSLSRGRGLEKSFYPSECGKADSASDWEALKKLGEEFLRDKEVLEAKFAEVMGSDLSREHKIELLRSLKEIALQVQAEYERRVTEKQQELQEHDQEIIDYYQHIGNELERQAESLREVKMEASQADASKAADAADAEKTAVEQKREEYLEKLRQNVERLERQREQILDIDMDDR